MSLKPQNLIQAAEADLRRRRQNIDLQELRDAAKQAGAPFHYAMEEYAFLGEHVRKAKSAKELLLLALMRPRYRAARESPDELELATPKANTRLIYGNGALLVAALRMLGE